MGGVMSQMPQLPVRLNVDLANNFLPSRPVGLLSYDGGMTLLPPPQPAVNAPGMVPLNGWAPGSGTISTLPQQQQQQQQQPTMQPLHPRPPLPPQAPPPPAGINGTGAAGGVSLPNGMAAPFPRPAFPGLPPPGAHPPSITGVTTAPGGTAAAAAPVQGSGGQPSDVGGGAVGPSEQSTPAAGGVPGAAGSANGPPMIRPPMGMPGMPAGMVPSGTAGAAGVRPPIPMQLGAPMGAGAAPVLVKKEVGGH